MISFSCIIVGVVNDSYSDLLFQIRLRDSLAPHTGFAAAMLFTGTHQVFPVLILIRHYRPFSGGFSWLWTNKEAMPLGCPEKNRKNVWILIWGVCLGSYSPLIFRVTRPSSASSRSAPVSRDLGDCSNYIKFFLALKLVLEDTLFLKQIWTGTELR